MSPRARPSSSQRRRENEVVMFDLENHCFARFGRLHEYISMRTLAGNRQGERCRTSEGVNRRIVGDLEWSVS